MFKVVLILTLVLVVAVSGHPEESIKGKKGKRCNADDYDCQCRKLLKPQKSDAGGKHSMKASVKACAAELGIKVPSKNAGGRYGKKMGKRSPGKFLERLPKELKQCVEKSVLKDIGALNSEGKIDSEALTTFLSKSMAANNNGEISGGQITSITDSIPGCITESEKETIRLFAIHQCISEVCVDVLEPHYE